MKDTDVAGNLLSTKGKLTIIYDDGKRRSVCVVNRYQADTVLEILEQNRKYRFATGEALAKALDDMWAHGRCMPDASLQVRVRVGEKIVQARHPIYWRVASVAMLFCATPNTAATELLKTRLRLFITGDNSISEISPILLLSNQPVTTT